MNGENMVVDQERMILVYQEKLKEANHRAVLLEALVNQQLTEIHELTTRLEVKDGQDEAGGQEGPRSLSSTG